MYGSKQHQGSRKESIQKLPLLNLENLASVCQLLSIEVDKNKSGTSDVLLRLM